MEQPAHKPEKRKSYMDHRGHRIHCKPCRHCGATVEIDLGPVVIATTGPYNGFADSIALAMVCCDACVAQYVSAEKARAMKEEAERLIQRRDVLPGFGRHALSQSDPTLEMMNRPAWQAGRDWIQGGMKHSMIVCGDGDSGKTHLCRTMVIEAWRSGRTILEVTGWDLFNGSMLYHSEDIVAKTQRMRRASVLYIQGIDRGEPKGKHLGLLLEIMEERHTRRLPTIMESQLAPAVIAERWKELTGDPSIGGDIFSRLHPVVKSVMQRPRENGGEIGMRQLEARRGNQP